MRLTRPLMASGGALGSSVGGWQSYEGAVPSNHAQLLTEGYQWSLPASKYDHPIVLPESGSNRRGFKTSGCFESFFKKEITFNSQNDPKAADTTDDFSDSPTGNVEACFIGDLKYRTEPKQKAISLKTELALRKGNHGLVAWGALSNLSGTNSSPMEEIRLVRLSKSGSNWEIKNGYTLYTTTQSSTYYSKLKLTLKGQEVFWGETNEWCEATKKDTSTSEECKNWDSLGSQSLKWFEIFEGSDSGLEQIFGRLVVEDPGSEEGYKYAFWIPKGKDWSSNTLYYPTEIYDTGSKVWKAMTFVSVGDTLMKWLAPFKGVKGTWHDGNTWCWDQAKTRGGAPSSLFKEICYSKVN